MSKHNVRHYFVQQNHKKGALVQNETPYEAKVDSVPSCPKVGVPSCPDGSNSGFLLLTMKQPHLLQI